ncbi:aminotransferase class I/II-fold pyridoxal phosphate-dependent enzyme [uncultured Intestinimonas sp.]|uniref:threonine aldolase family protein n=1 Tax=uncultured Intestinimonas sp. TaxID=1689265 RepID=UPI0025D8E2AA|nr:aminotransferase class I/II-fold pyridoxal phosphate-dependent enzyme [uncultured Intestinimonas sp.]
MKYLFRNDYSYGAHPKVLSALAQSSMEGNVGYGDDPYCQRAADLIRDMCQCPRADVQFLIGGTQTNFTAIAAFLRPWEGVIAADSSHINGHEVGAVEATGHKILQIAAGNDGKIAPEQIAPILERHKDPHLVKPRLVEIADATESGMVYTKAELTALSEYCRANGLLLFVDGARLGAAMTSPANDLTMADLARLTDAFYIGGTKNGALMGEALVIVNEDLQPDFFRIKKQLGAVLAKGWLLGVQFEALFQDGLYFEMARHANAMAARLQAGLKAKGWKLWVESPTNQVFAVVPDSIKPRIDAVCAYEDWCPAEEPGHTVIRFVSCFQTGKEDVDGLLSALPEL